MEKRAVNEHSGDSQYEQYVVCFLISVFVYLCVPYLLACFFFSIFNRFSSCKYLIGFYICISKHSLQLLANVNTTNVNSSSNTQRFVLLTIVNRFFCLALMSTCSIFQIHFKRLHCLSTFARTLQFHSSLPMLCILFRFLLNCTKIFCYRLWSSLHHSMQ